jgi:hypothetical protein
MTSGSRSIAFFDEQFRRSPTAAAVQLNPFEEPLVVFQRGRSPADGP